MRKQCKGCGKYKQESKFYVMNASKDGLQAQCKVCDKDRLREFYQKDIELNRKKRRDWQDENPDLHLEHMKTYHDKKRKEKEQDE